MSSRSPDRSDAPDEDPPGEAALETSAHAFCPYCGERVELLVDPGGGPKQEYVEDCEVCCRPWRVKLRIGAGGGVEVELASLDES